MLARLSRDLPVGGYLYEPKWDGFRMLAFRSGDEVDLRSRHGRPLARYFPELVAAVRSLDAQEIVLDGEAVIVRDGVSDFAALLARLHPAASRVERLARETPAVFVAFDVLVVGSEDLQDRPFEERRRRLSEVLRDASPPLFLTPATEEPEVAAGWLARYEGAGVDGIVAKHRDLRYRPGVRAMVKIKRRRTADCVVAGFRWLADLPLVSSLMLGVHDPAGRLQHVGVVSSMPAAMRRGLVAELGPLARTLLGHPWEHGFLVDRGALGRLKGSAGTWSPGMSLDWVPVEPIRVCEVGYDQLDGGRFRHPARFIRWRPDREPRSCTFDQFESSMAPHAELLGIG
jgi:ATP-dependent DNA ligase